MENQLAFTCIISSFSAHFIEYMCDAPRVISAVFPELHKDYRADAKVTHLRPRCALKTPDVCSSVCSSIAASDGLTINFNGDSGGGKSHACRSMLHLIPQKWWNRRSLSDKAIFYSDSIQPDMIFFSDDTAEILQQDA